MTAKYAVLVETFGLTMRQVYNLTPRQIDAIYFHPRNDKGEILAPRTATGPETPEQHVARLQRLILMKDFLNYPPEVLAELQRRLEEATRGEPER